LGIVFAGVAYGDESLDHRRMLEPLRPSPQVHFRHM
jgi:hypothetical protein